MIKIEIKPTQNPTIIKFEFPDFISRNNSYEFKNIDEANQSPLAQKLFYLPFVKTVYISGNFVAIERFSIVEWSDVQDQVAQEIEDFVNKGGVILNPETNTKKQAISIYGETTPNPASQKFVANILLTKKAFEFKDIDQAAVSPLAFELFKFPFVKEVFIDENYVSITKYDSADWNEISLELRTFIKQFIENGGIAIDPNAVPNKEEQETILNEAFDKLDVTSQQIINILEEYVKPAVQSDGGNIVFHSFDPATKVTKVLMQGACNGCPSSTFTLKSGIENMLKSMLNDNEITVEAVN